MRVTVVRRPNDFHGTQEEERVAFSEIPWRLDSFLFIKTGTLSFRCERVDVWFMLSMQYFLSYLQVISVFILDC